MFSFFEKGLTKRISLELVPCLRKESIFKKY